MYTVDMYRRVRRAHFVEGMSIREAARVFGLHRDTVNKMLEYDVLPVERFRKISVGEAEVLPLAQNRFLRIVRAGHTAPSAAGISLQPLTDLRCFSSHCPPPSRYL